MRDAAKIDGHHRAAAKPLDSLWQTGALVWVVLAGEGLALVLSLAPDSSHAHWTYFALASLVIQWVLFLSLGMLYLARRQLRARSPQAIARIALALFVGNTLVVCCVARALTATNVADQPPPAWPGFALRIAGLALTVGLLGLAAFQNHWRARKAAVRAKQADLEALQARIRPHFLFNTLNTATALVHTSPDQAERVLLDLADLFRASLGKSSLVSLHDELELTQRYLDIEKLRFGPRLSLEWDVPDTLPAVLVPPLSIQPLVENAVRHGIEPSVNGGVVRVGLVVSGGFVLIEISNVTHAPRESAQQSTGHGVGLRASVARIEDATAGRGSVEVSTDGGRYISRVRLPIDDPAIT